MKKDPIIEVKDIRKTYRSGMFGRRKTEALRGLSLSIEKGEIFGVLGPNGAGKTTLLNIIIGMLTPDEGSIHIMGKDVTRGFSNDLKEKMNMCSGNPNFPWSMSVEEALIFYSMLYGNCSGDCIEKAIKEFELEKVRKKQYDELSTGNKQRLAMAKAVLNDPEILLLDEPTSGLDPDISRRVRAEIKKMHGKGKRTIILTTHNMREASELCDRIAFIRDGKILALGTGRQIIKKTRTKDLEEAFIALAN